MISSLSNNSFNTEKRATDSHVVILTNYLRKHHVLAYQALENCVGKLTILLSTPMEPDRSWGLEWQNLNVTVQKNWMLTRKWRYRGFTNPNFIHIPVDTKAQLESLQPDIVFSYEMGMRTYFCTRFRRKNPGVPLVMVGNMSDYIERERGIARRMLRSYLLNRVDFCTYNGPSCHKYLRRLGVEESRMFHVPYCFDLDKSFHGDKSYSQNGILRFIFVGVLHPRKGLDRLSQAFGKWSRANPGRKIELVVCGDGDGQLELERNQTDDFKMVFRGNCDADQLRDAYEAADVCAFPTMADEWGLVPIEAMASGLPVLGSRYAQSVESLILPDETGWIYYPDNESELMTAIEQCMNKSIDEIETMGSLARRSVEHVTPERTAECFCHAIDSIFTGQPGLPLAQEKSLRNRELELH